MMVPLASNCSYSVILSSLLAKDTSKVVAPLQGVGRGDKTSWPSTRSCQQMGRWKAGALNGHLRERTRDVSAPTTGLWPNTSKSLSDTGRRPWPAKGQHVAALLPGGEGDLTQKRLCGSGFLLFFPFILYFCLLWFSLAKLLHLPQLWF